MGKKSVSKKAVHQGISVYSIILPRQNYLRQPSNSTKNRSRLRVYYTLVVSVVGLEVTEKKVVVGTTEMVMDELGTKVDADTVVTIVPVAGEDSVTIVPVAGEDSVTIVPGTEDSVTIVPVDAVVVLRKPVEHADGTIVSVTVTVTGA